MTGKPSKVMSAAQYRAAIEELELSQVAAGKLLGLSPRQAQRIASGESPVPFLVDRVIRLLLARRIQVADL